LFFSWDSTILIFKSKVSYTFFCQAEKFPVENRIEWKNEFPESVQKMFLRRGGGDAFPFLYFSDQDYSQKCFFFLTPKRLKSGRLEPYFREKISWIRFFQIFTWREHNQEIKKNGYHAASGLSETFGKTEFPHVSKSQR
jgi:hypothetical protein